jgi:hypothetical protein
MNNLYDENIKMINQDTANLAFGIVFQLLLSSVENMKKFEEPIIGDWCIELSTISKKSPDLLGIVREVTSNGYITQTVLGQTVTWTNCRMIKIPNTLLDNQLHTELLQLLKSNCVEVDCVK